MRGLRWALFLAAVVVAPCHVLAQGPPVSRPLRVDVEALFVTVSRVWSVSSAWSLGPELGMGVHEQKTLAPAGGDFTSGVHLGVVAAVEGGFNRALDFALRVGLGDLLESGDVPEVYAGFVTSATLGGERLRVGTRFTAANMWTSGQGSSLVLSWSPLLLRVRF